jgi:S1-C subfamily serine protease
LDPAGPAARLGVQKRDVLLQLDRFLVLSLDDLGRVLEDVKGSQVLWVRIIRGNTGIGAGIQTRSPSSRPASGPTLPAGGAQARAVKRPRPDRG